jgi:hypothetical protein
MSPLCVWLMPPGMVFEGRCVEKKVLDPAGLRSAPYP